MLATDLKELKDGYKHLDVKKDVESKANNVFVSELERKIIDLQNRLNQMARSKHCLY